MVHSRPNPVQHMPVQNHAKNSLRCQVDMLDITKRHGTRMRLKPEGGHPFWVTAKDLPRKVRMHAQNMEARLVLECRKGRKPAAPLHEGMNTDSFRKLLASPGTKLLAA